MSKYRRVRFFETHKVKSLPLLWIQCSWFSANLKSFLTQWIQNWMRFLSAKK